MTIAASMLRTSVVVLDGRWPMDPTLAAWFARWPLGRQASQIVGSRAAMRRVGTAGVRRAIARWFLASDDAAARGEWLLMIDDDMLPGPEIGPLVAYEGPLSGARYIGPDGREAHPGEDEIGLACFKVSRAILEAVGPDAFRTLPGATCDCPAFLAACAERGVLPAKLGCIDHVIPMVARVGGPGKRCKLAFRFPNPPTAAQAGRTGDRR